MKEERWISIYEAMRDALKEREDMIGSLFEENARLCKEAREAKNEAGEWKFIGTTRGGKRFFLSNNKKIAVEQDHLYLTKPTEEELLEIYMVWPTMKNV